MMSKVPKVMGGINIRVGNKVKMWRGVIREHGEDVENDSGRRLLKFSAEYGLQVMNTHFDHKQIHKFSWSCSDKGMKSIIDF